MFGGAANGVMRCLFTVSLNSDKYTRLKEYVNKFNCKLPSLVYRLWPKVNIANGLKAFEANYGSVNNRLKL